MRLFPLRRTFSYLLVFISNVCALSATPPASKAIAPEIIRQASVADSDEYRIGPGDVLQVLVWKEPEASVPSTVVRPDGRIAVPLIKEVNVAGLTTREAQDLITKQLEVLIHGVDVTVVVASINSKKIYVIGAVRKEGPIALRTSMSVLQALSEAGGVTEYARKKKIYILRSVNGKESRLPFDYEAVIRGNPVSNIQVRADDTIVIPQ